MALRPILKFPDPRLRQVSRPVKDPAAQGRLVEDMAETMYAANGAGLAAVQVGELLRLFIVDAALAGLPENTPPIVFVNPEIIELGEETETTDEGCLSFPQIYLPVARPLKIRVRALDLEGKPFEMGGENLLARALQHELDHINGRLIVDYVGRIKRQLIQRRLARAEA